MLFHGTVQLWDSGSRLTFHITDVSTAFSLGQIEARRREVLAQLRREGLCDINGRLPLSDVPLRIGVVSSRAARGYDDFLQVLKASGFGFSLFHHDVPVQGPDMEQAVCQALSLFAAHQRTLQLDAVCVVRGGGSATDLGWWNSYAIAAAVARMPMPVMCGIGHGLDRVAVDEVVFKRLATPTAAAQFFVDHTHVAKTGLHNARNAICEAASSVMSRHRHTLAAHRTTLVDLGRGGLSGNKYILGTMRVAISEKAAAILTAHQRQLSDSVHALIEDLPRCASHARHRLHDLIHGVREAASLLVALASRELNSVRNALPAHARLALAQCRRLLESLELNTAQAALQQLHAEIRRLRTTKDSLPSVCGVAVLQERQRLRKYKELIEALDPRGILKRGYSITLDRFGKAIRDGSAVDAGAAIVTLLAKGQLQSTVTETSTD